MQHEDEDSFDTAADKDFDWVLFVSIVVPCLLTALLLCWCFCGLYIWFVLLTSKSFMSMMFSCFTSPLIDRASKYATHDKPVLYSMEHNPDFYWSDSYTWSDTSLGPYMNVGTPSSDTSIVPTPEFRSDSLPVASPEHSSSKPLIHVFLPRIRMIDRENKMENIGHIVDKEGYARHPSRRSTIMRVAHVRSPIERTIYVKTASDELTTREANGPDRSESVSYFYRTSVKNSSPNYRLVRVASVDSESPTEVNHMVLRHRAFQSVSSLPSVSSRIRVERKPIRRRKIRMKNSFSFSFMRNKNIHLY